MPAYASGPYLRPGRDPVPRLPPRGRALHRARLPRHEDEGGRRPRRGRAGGERGPEGRRAPTSSCSPTRTRATPSGPRSRPGASSRRKASPGSRSPSRRTTSRGMRTWPGRSGSPSSAGRRSEGSAPSGPSSSGMRSTPPQPDLAIAGGFTEVARVAALAAAWEVPIVPHVWGTRGEPLRVAPALRRAARLPEPHVHAVPVVRVRPVAEPAARAVGARMVEPRERSGRDAGMVEIAPRVPRRWRSRRSSARSAFPRASYLPETAAPPRPALPASR